MSTSSSTASSTSSSTVAYLGPPGTFTHQAALGLRPDGEAVAHGSAAAALAAVVTGEAAYAVVPIDNSVNGVVVPTLDALLDRPELSIVDSAVLPISFDAFTLGGSGEVPPTVVVSHPHALAQCRAWVAAQGLATREAASTAAACRDLAPGEVAVGPRICGDLYGLRTLAEGVEDNAGALTQFALVSATALPVRGGGDEGLLVTLLPDANAPGALRRLLGVLEQRGINMTNLVTRPLPANPGLFTFVLFLSGTFSADDFAELADEWRALSAGARAVGRISPLHELARRS